MWLVRRPIRGSLRSLRQRAYREDRLLLQCLLFSLSRRSKLHARRKHTGQTREALCKRNSLYAGNFLTARLPQQGLTRMATQASARRSAHTELCAADSTQALRVQAHRADTGSTLQAEFVVCGQLSDSQAASARPHANGHPSERTPLSTHRALRSRRHSGA